MQSSCNHKNLLVLGCGGFIGSHLLDRIFLSRHDVFVEGFDLSESKIESHIKDPRFRFHNACIHDASLSGELHEAIRNADAVINLTAICNPSEYNTRPVSVIRQNCFYIVPVLDLCAQFGKWLIQFSTSEVYGRTISSYVTDEDYSDPALFVQTEDATALVMGPIKNQRWSYAAAKQLLERYVFALHHEHGLRFTIIRPYNFFGSRMDYIPGRDGEGVPRVLACFMGALLNGLPMQLVDGGTARRTITSIHDAIDALMLMLANPFEAQNQIFNIGDPKNEVTVRQLALLMRNIFAEVADDERFRRHEIREVSSLEFYGPGYEDCDRRVPDISKATQLLGWAPTRALEDTLREVITYYYELFGLRNIAEAAE